MKRKCLDCGKEAWIMEDEKGSTGLCVKCYLEIYNWQNDMTKDKKWLLDLELALDKEYQKEAVEHIIKWELV